MATKYECDRCGTQFSSSLHLWTITMKKDAYTDETVRELCGDCVYVVEKALAKPAKPKPLEPPQ